MPKIEPQRESEAGSPVSSLEEERRRRQVERLNSHHGPYLRSLARKLCRTQHDPDDLVQDVLEKLLRTPIPSEANERAWLSRVTYNLFIDRVRRAQARREELTGDPVVPAAEPPDEPRWWERLTQEQIVSAMERLPADQRTTFELFAFQGKSYDEIAASQGIAKATVGTRILRARQRLRALFIAEHADE